jgi:Xaa-Pro aminopeptidase
MKVMRELNTGLAVLYGADQPASNSPVEAPFHQDGDFAWLTGITDEPGAVLILVPKERDVREILLLPSRNPEAERWVTERVPLGAELERRTGFQQVGRTGGLGSIVTSLAARHKELHFLGPIVGSTASVPASLDLYSKVAQRVPGTKTTDSSTLLPSLRIVKESRELAMMKRAIAATGRGHRAAMRAVRPGWTEERLKSLLEAEFKAAGSQGLGYDSIIGAGRHAASLHYTGGSGTIRSGDMILIDAGASVGGYASDITRTFPASGKFTPKQRADYDLVLAAQNAAVAKLKAGVYYYDIQEAAKNVFRQAGRIDEFTHGLGHFVGLHVHDAGDLSQPLPAGAVITVEPGLYLQAENYGIRIEDMYLITAAGSEHLSAGIPRTSIEIERYMARD